MNKTTFRRTKRDKNFAVINTHAIRNPELSWKAKGLHTYLCQLPDDWVINQEDLKSRATDGRDGLRSAIKELEDAGYLKRMASRDGGKFAGVEYVVVEEPLASTVDGFSGDGFPDIGKSDTTKYEKNKVLNKDILSGNENKSKPEQVIAHLNTALKTRYSANSKSTRKLLDARLKDYSVEDICNVIDDRIERWQGTDMAEYLRPSTLFRPTNFENYFNAIAVDHGSKVNTPEALADCVLSPELEEGYQKYIAYSRDHYPDLFASTCRILSKSEFKEIKLFQKYKGIPFRFTPRAVHAELLEAQAELNDNKWKAKDTQSVFDYLLHQKLQVA